jgi:ectoine hydrolase
MSIPKQTAFTAAEFRRRQDEVRRRAQGLGLDALLLSLPSSIVYLTGYTGMSGYVPQVLLLRCDTTDDPTLWMRLQDRPGALHLTHLADDLVVGYPEAFVGHPDQDGHDYILRQIGSALLPLRVGLEFDALSHAALRKWQARLPVRELVDAAGIVDGVRIVKSNAEVAVMREAAAIADAAMGAATAAIHEGARECDVAALVAAAAVRGLPDCGSTHLEVPLICSTPRTGTPHICWTEDRYRQGTQVNVELGGTRHRYSAGLMRTFHIGPPPDRLKRLHEAELVATDAALAAARPGARCNDVAGAFCRALEQHGFRKDSRCGYAIGIDWIEPAASLSLHDRTELQPGMTFHLMLGNWISEDFGYVLSETILITPHGVEALTRTPRKLFIH